MPSKYFGLQSQLNEVKRKNFIYSISDEIESFHIKTLIYENIADFRNLKYNPYYKKEEKYYEWVETFHLENYSLFY